MQRTRTHRLTLVAVLAVLTGPAAAADYEPADFLPLAVGNSWSFRHIMLDLYGEIFDDRNPPWQTGVVTITVERTEVIGDTTYYVLSDLPSGWAPAPPHCPVGKKLRWKGSDLMVRTDTGEQSFFRFRGDAYYTIPLTHGDDEVMRRGSGPTRPVPRSSFWFHGYDGWTYPGFSGRYVGFLAGYGLDACSEFTEGEDHGVYKNSLEPLQATLVETSGSGSGSGGDTRKSDDAGPTTRKVGYGDAEDGHGLPPSATAPSTWGQVKESSP